MDFYYTNPDVNRYDGDSLFISDDDMVVISNGEIKKILMNTLMNSYNKYDDEMLGNYTSLFVQTGSRCIGG